MTEPHKLKAKVFFSYSHKDEELRDRLAEHLSPLRRDKTISEWHDRKITAGSNVDDKIDENLNNADIILLLVSSAFINSDYCFDNEMVKAVKRHEAGEARVIPIILRPCDWHDAPFGKLLALPKDGTPLTKWTNIDEGFLYVAREIRKVVEELQNPVTPAQEIPVNQVVKSNKVKITLPSPVVSFVPRHDEDGKNLVAKLNESLNSSENHTVVLWGSGGVGKTTLAVQFANASELEKQVIWIDANNRPDISAGILLDEITTQFGQPEVRQLPPSLKYQQTLSLLTETPSLVILDNFETLKPEYQLECLEFLKTREFDSLITTRERLEGVRNINVFEMSESEAQAFLDRLIEDSALPGVFSEAIRQKIMQTAERNALLMQWVVGQIDAAQSPREVFEDLEHGEGAAAERVFNRSFNLPQLGNDGRSILLALSLFAQSARRKSVKGVVGFGDDNKRFNKALKGLVNLRLLNVAPESERLFLGGLTRQFARAYLDKSGNSMRYRQKYIRYFESFCESHSNTTFVDLDLLEEERVNIFPAIALAFELEQWQSVFSISRDIAEFLRIRGFWEDLIRNNEEVAKLARRLDKKRQISVFTNSLGIIYSEIGQIEKAEDLYNESLKILKTSRDLSGISIVLNNLGGLASDKGEIEKAEDLFYESLEIKRKLGDQSGIGTALNNLGSLAFDKGEIEKAEDLFNESLEIRRKSGHHSDVGSSLNNLGSLAFDKGEIEKAEDLYNESLEIRRKLGDLLGIATGLSDLGKLALDKGEIEKAEDLFNKSLEINRKLGNHPGIARLLFYFAELYFLKTNTDESEKLCRESLEIYEKLKIISGVNENKRLLGKVFQSRGDFIKAQEYYDDSLAIFRSLGYKKEIALTLKEAASLTEIQGDKSRAIKLYEESLSIFERLGSPKANDIRGALKKLTFQN